MRAKRKKIIIIVLFVVVTLTIVAAVAVVRSARPGYSSVLAANWGFSLPDEALCKELYEKDSGESFHGDGVRYHVFVYEEEDSIGWMLPWKTVEGGTVYSSSYSEAAGEWLKEISASREYYPNYEECLYWYAVQNDSSEIIVFWDDGMNRLYIVESFL